jgi:putative flavoprotein involved in K+ transport
MSRAELVGMFESWAASFKAPVSQNTRVLSLDTDSGGEFVLSVEGGQVRARSVVVASGAYQKAHQPYAAKSIPKSVNQVLAEDYRNPGAVPPGNVLIVGSGQTGCQIAEELNTAGRKVFLACGRSPWVPRRFGNHDFLWWLIESGFADRTPDKLRSPADRLVANPQATGHRGGRDLHFRTLHEAGVDLLGRLSGVDGSTLHFADDLGASVDFGDARWAEIRGYVDAYCAEAGITRPEYEIPPPMRIKTRARLDTALDGIETVIWTSGYRPEYSWVKLPVFDEMGFPEQVDGRSSVPGLYFMGVHWMRKNKSAALYGVAEDAAVVARQIIERRS